MRIVIENLPHDVAEEEVRAALSLFAPGRIGRIALVKEGNRPTAVIETDTTHVEAVSLAMRITGHIHKGQRLRAWVPRWQG